MRSRPIPTSLSSQSATSSAGSLSGPQLALIIVFVIAISSGTLIGLGELARRYPQVPLFSKIPIRGATQSVVVKQVDTTDTEQVQKITRAVSSSLVTIVRAPNGRTYQPTDRLAVGLSVTSDGLIVTSSTLPEATALHVLSSPNGDVSATKTKNSYQGLSFLTTGSHTTPIAFVEPVNLDEGTAVWVAKYEGFSGGLTLARAGLASLHASTGNESFIESSDQGTRKLVLDRFFSNAWDGSAVVNGDGKLIGFLLSTSAEAQIIPAYAIESSLSVLAKGDSVTAASFGVTYVDLAYARQGSDYPTKGALITGPSAIVRNSPAEKAALQVGDVITAIDGEPLTTRRSLADIVSEKTAGASLKCAVIRNSTAIQVTVVTTATST